MLWLILWVPPERCTKLVSFCLSVYKQKRLAFTGEYTPKCLFCCYIHLVLRCEAPSHHLILVGAQAILLLAVCCITKMTLL